MLVWVGAASAQPQRFDEIRPEDRMLLAMNGNEMVCSFLANGNYERGPTYRSLSCRDYYARVVALAGLTDVSRMAAFACWVFDPCGYPK